MIESKLKEEAKQRLAKARRTPFSKYASHEKVKKKFLGEALLHIGN